MINLHSNDTNFIVNFKPPFRFSREKLNCINVEFLNYRSIHDAELRYYSSTSVHVIPTGSAAGARRSSLWRL